MSVKTSVVGVFWATVAGKLGSVDVETMLAGGLSDDSGRMRDGELRC